MLFAQAVNKSLWGNFFRQGVTPDVQKMCICRLDYHFSEVSSEAQK